MSLKLFTHMFKVMGGPAELQLYLQNNDAAVFQLAENEARRLENKYSRYLNNSVTSNINACAGKSEGIDLDKETAALLNYADIAWQQSDGLFDITSGVLRKAWDFKSNQLPKQKQLNELLKNIGWDKLNWNAPHLTLPANMELDFGGIVKEYAADAMTAILRNAGVQHGLVDLAGDIGIIGPHPDGTPWKIGIRNPEKTQTAIATLDAYNGGIASSGNYERFMIVNGSRYCHILNPKTGWPVNGVAAASVHASTCMVAGTATTTAMLLGAAKGRSWLEEGGFNHLLLEE